MCDALRGMLTGFVLRLRGAHFGRWNAQVAAAFGRLPPLAKSILGSILAGHSMQK